MSIPDAPWIGFCGEEWRERQREINKRSEDDEEWEEENEDED